MKIDDEHTHTNNNLIFSCHCFYYDLFFFFIRLSIIKQEIVFYLGLLFLQGNINLNKQFITIETLIILNRIEIKIKVLHTYKKTVRNLNNIICYKRDRCTHRYSKMLGLVCLRTLIYSYSLLDNEFKKFYRNI